MHEHIVVLGQEAEANYPSAMSEEEIIDKAVVELDALKSAGIDTLVDVTVIPMGRDVRRIKRIAERTSVQIIVATGIYTFDELPGRFGIAEASGPDCLAEMFIRDATVGTADSGVRAGVLKCATDRPGLTRGVELVLRAVARAHRATGIPITTHTNAVERNGLEQQRVFAGEGVDLSRVVIGHCGDTSDTDYLEALAQRGSFLGMDRFGIAPPTADERVDVVARMCELGYASQMVLSHDYASFNDQLPAAFYEANPEWGYRFISDNVVPSLRARGVGDDELRAMLIDNPRRIFESDQPY